MATSTLIRRTALAAGIAAALSLSACAGLSASDAPDTSADTVAANQEITPLSTEELEALLATSAERNLLPGAFAMIKTPEGTVTASVGSTSLETNRPPQRDDVFRVGSVTKTMTAITILQLVDEGSITLADPIENHIPGIPGGGNITIANLLQMRSGIHNYLDTDGFAAVFNADMTTQWSPEELIAFGTEYPAGAAPDTVFDYSNTNTVLLGILAEQIDGKPLAEIFRYRLFAPLGMSDTELPSATTFSLPNTEVQGYQYGTFPINHGPLLAASEREAARAGTLQPNVVTAQSPSWSWAAGGVTSTADDLMVWAEALASGELLSTEMYQTWLHQVAPMDPTRGENGPQYGLGIEQSRFGANRLYLHEGELPGFNTMVATDPANNVSFVVWTNLALSVDGAPNAKAFAADLIGALYSTSLKAPVTEPRVS